MNGTTTKKKRQMLITLSGEFCKCCGYYEDSSKLVLNHKDNNLKNNELDNLQLLCRSCDYLRNKTSEHDDLCVKQETDQETCLSINRKKEPIFRRNVYDELLECDGRLCTEIIYEQAEELCMSPVTTKRYLNKMIKGMYLTTVNTPNGIFVKFHSDSIKSLFKSALEYQRIKEL